ncbi:hypothetical protein GCM10009696_36980 [Kocuria himachalensis]
MDDETIGADQARRLRAGLQTAELKLDTLWMHYFSLGGTVDQMEVEAYLHHALTLPGLQRDLLAHALGELTDRRRVPLIPFTADYSTPDGRAYATEDEQHPPAGPQHRGEEKP